MSKPNNRNSYDTVPYPSHAFPQTHPDRLATLGRLFGMSPKDIYHCKILELGCGDASNLLPLAVNFPESNFTGLDLSPQALTKGQTIIDELGLKNIQLLEKDINTVDQSLGKFDYIIAHGLFSWVNEATQEKIFTICQDHLHPQGIAYVSYNTYPGWHMRGMLRDMMVYHTRTFEKPQQKIEQARALIYFLSQSVSTDDAYGMLLKSELEKMYRWDDNYLYHDSLETINEPIYFHQFMERAKASGLQFLAEAEFSTMVPSNFEPKVKDTLTKIGKDIIAMEQYMDFLRNRLFRQTLLCRSETKLSRSISANALRDFHIAAPMKPESEMPDIFSDEAEVFQVGNAGTLTAKKPLSKATWSFLAEIWPQAAHFDILLKSVNAKLEVKDEAEQEHNAARLADILLRMYTKNIVHLYSHPPEFTIAPNTFPLANPLARWQAAHNQAITNQRHEMLQQDDINRFLLPMLDGKHHILKIEAALAEAVSKGTLTIERKGEAVEDEEQIDTFIHEQLEARLTLLAKAALLIQ